MKVILLQDVKDIGKRDDIVNVSDGYARNFLFPRKVAMEATDSAVKVVERKREAERRKEAEARAAAEQIASKLKNKVVILKVKCGVDVDKRKVEIKEAVHQLGDYEVNVRLYPNVSSKMILRVKNIQEG